MQARRKKQTRTSFGVTHDMLDRIKARCASLGFVVAAYVRVLVWNDLASPSAELPAALTRIPPSRLVQTPHSYTLPADLRKWARARAKALNLDQSAYLVALIQLDLERGGPLTVACVKPPA